METGLGVAILGGAAAGLLRILRAAWHAEATAQLARQTRAARREQWRRAGTDLPPKVKAYLEEL